MSSHCGDVDDDNDDSNGSSDKGHMMIILRFKGECLTGPDDGYAKNGKSTNCWSGVGGEYTDYTYKFND